MTKGNEQTGKGGEARKSEEKRDVKEVNGARA